MCAFLLSTFELGLCHVSAVTCGDQKRASDHLELELPGVVSLSRVLGPNQGLLDAKQALTTAEPLLQHCSLFSVLRQSHVAQVGHNLVIQP